MKQMWKLAVAPDKLAFLEEFSLIYFMVVIFTKPASSKFCISYSGNFLFYGYSYLKDFIKPCECPRDYKEMIRTICALFLCLTLGCSSIDLFECFLGIIEEQISTNSMIWIIDRHAGADEKVKLEEEVKFKDVSNKFNTSP